jgi:predicted nucleotidyltransferase
MTGLTKKTLDEVAKRLAESIHPEQIYLFGSHAAGNADKNSVLLSFRRIPQET